MFRGFPKPNIFSLMMQAIARALAIVGLFASPALLAATPLFDGDFESGTFQGWAPGGTGSAIVAARGTCFSSNDTTELLIRDNYAGLLRGIKGKKEDLPSLTSRSFVAGAGVAFLALSEWRGNKVFGREHRHPFALTASILDGSGNLLRKRDLATAMVPLSSGCPSSSRDAAFHPLYIDTRAFAGKPIKIRFTQHFDTALTGAFTLIDEVVSVGVDEVPTYHSYPFAIAGTGRTTSGTLMLLAEEPALGTPSNWQFSWYVNGETARRPYYNPCLDDLDQGSYTATLYVRVNDIVATDTIRFIVPPQEESTTTDASEETDDSSASTTTDELCNVRHPSLLPTNSTDSTTDDEDDETTTTTDPDDTSSATDPAISATFVNSLATGVSSEILSNVSITVDSEATISSGFIRLTNSADTSDSLSIDANQIHANFEVSCTQADRNCTLSSSSANLGNIDYETAFENFKLNLSSIQVNVELGITDSNNSRAVISEDISNAVPVVTLSTNSPFAALSDTAIFNSLSITTVNNVNLQSASLQITGLVVGDALIAPSSTTNPITTCNPIDGSAGNLICSWDAEASSSAYASAISAVQINMVDSINDRTLTLTVTDTNNQSTTTKIPVTSQ